jgi:hypothetical protein
VITFAAGVLLGVLLGALSVAVGAAASQATRWEEERIVASTAHRRAVDRALDNLREAV